MTPEQMDADLRAAVDERLAQRRDAARRKAEAQRRARQEKTVRRTAGLRLRHQRKIDREESAMGRPKEPTRDEVRQAVGEAFFEWLNSRPMFFMRDLIEDGVKAAMAEWLDRPGSRGSAHEDTGFTGHEDWYHRGPCCACALCGGNECFVWNPNDPDFPEVHICENCTPMKRSNH